MKNLNHKRKTAKSSESENYILPHLIDHDGDTSKRWMITYYVMNIATGKLKRKRYTSINDSIDPQERWKQARQAIKEITQKLKDGYVVNEIEDADLISEDDYIDANKSTYLEVLDWGIKKKGLDVGRNQKKDYKGLYNHIKKFLEERNKEKIAFKQVDSKLIISFFDWYKAKGRAKKTFNNIHTNFHALYEELIRRKVTHLNLCKEEDKLKGAERGGKHIPYTPEEVEKIYNAIIEKKDYQLLLFCQSIYYLFLRPRTELRFLQVQHLKEDTIFIPPHIAKTPEGRHITLPDPLNELFNYFGIRNYPSHFYIFSILGCPGEKHVGYNYFYKRFVEILKDLGLNGQGKDMYSMKHTGNLALVVSNVNIKFIQDHNRHTTLRTTQRYLENIGAIMKADGIKNFPKFVPNSSIEHLKEETLNKAS